MAATVVPDMSRGGRIHNPRQLSLPIGGILDLKESFGQTDVSVPSEGPPPNPPFCFPSKTMSASTPRTAGRRPRSAVDMSGSNTPRPLGSPALPAFSFNPGANLTPEPFTLKKADDFLTPPRSPRLSPSRPGHGHKRGGSEFVGGEYRSGNARMEVLSTEGQNDMSSPQLLPATDPRPRGPAHRHAHRRSAAMSSHDLNSVLGLNLPKNAGESRGSSAPSSPSGPELNKHFSFPLLRPDEIKRETEKPTQAQPNPIVEADLPESPASTVEPTASPGKFSKARVGFSDTLEFIPRPLSLISSDASSTATVRPGHSVSGSYSSIISISNSVIMEEFTTVLEPTQSQSGSRPSTAGAVLDRTLSQNDNASGGIAMRRGSMPLLTEITLPAHEPTSSADPSPAKSSSSKKWSFFGLDHFPGSASPSKSRPASLNSCEVSKEIPSELKQCSSYSDFQCAGDKGNKKHGKKQRKVKHWAGSILTKRSKGRYGKGKKAIRRGPTPPPLRQDDEDDEDNVSDSAETKSEPGMPTVMITELDDQDQGGAEAWKPPRPATEADTAYPVIDLDAALGPFNTPLPQNAEWEAAQKAGGLSKRQLHSAAGMSRFSGPGMHYTNHQRAQSSPEMPPFEFRRGISRFGSNSTMADVFEEEEEEDDSDNGKSSSSTGSSTPQAESAPLQNTYAANLNGFFSARGSAERMSDKDATSVPKRKGSDPEDSKPQRTGSMKSRNSQISLQEQVIDEESELTSPSFRNVEFGRPAQQRFSAVLDSPLSSPVSPRAPESTSSQTTVSSLAPVSPYSTTGSSSFPSPRSLLYDGTILSTAPSSVTDDSYHSLLMGEPGPEVRKSLDVPSLASSHSTQPRENLFAQQAAQMNRAPAPGERPASFSMMGFGGRRGSLASLSRLISSSHGERSKLSLEVSYNSDSENKNQKGSKSKRRLSRMVQFWKTKEDTKK
ncbi:hypothetical protein N0V82_002591 [Gnomoniopsis sp. IMI 355080]|nr:hypothetical protein N0V82_002591 [Gnomoniopsis sp. IMI 355080]